MSTLIFKLTAAGLAALVNAANDGTQARTVASVGITATAIAPGGAIANEIKRITTIAGVVVADDTIHVTIRDDGPDTYTVRGFGLYLDNGVLLGSYGQATPIIEKSSASILMLAVDARVLDASADISTLLFGDASFANPPATTERKGIVELATTAETATGTDTSRAVVPAGLKPLLDGKQPLDATLTAIAALVTAANQLIYATGPDAFATTALSAFMRTLLDDTDAATARATLGAAPLANPAFTGAPTVPTAVAGTNTTQIANTAFVQEAVAALIASSPAALDTLNELAQALGNDPNFATTVAEAIALKAPLNSPALTGAPTAPTASIGSSDQRIANTEFVQSAIAATLGSGGIVPTGSVIHVTANSAPTGYLKVNGATLSRTAYAGLWAYAQGSGNLAASEAGKPRGQFGPGDGATTFTIPDARGDFIRSWSDGSTIDSGRTLGSFQDHALQTHNHRIDVNRNLAYAGGGGRANDAPDVNDAYSGNGGIDRTSAPVTGNTAAETRPRNIAWLACIKY